MKRNPHDRRTQPNSEPLRPAGKPEPEDASYDLEDIIREFGGWSRREAEPEQEPAEPEPTVPEPPEQPQEISEQPPRGGEPQEGVTPDPAAEPEVPGQLPAEKKKQPSGRFRFITLDSHAPAADAPGTPTPQEIPPETEGVPRRRRAEGRKRPEKRARPQRPRPQKVPKAPKTAPEIPDPTPEEAYRTAGKAEKGLTTRRRLMLVLFLLSALVTAANWFGLSVGGRGMDAALSAKILLSLLLIGAVLGYDVFVEGVYQLLKLRCSLESLLVVCAVVFAAAAFRYLDQSRIPYTAVLTLGLYFSLWGRGLRCTAERRSLKAVLSMAGHPSAAVLKRKAWNGRDCVLRADGTTEGFVRALRAPDAASQAMRYYAPLMLALSLVIAAVCRLVRSSSFLCAWSTILAGSIPAAAFVSYTRPFSAAARRLLHSGAALCGWEGAKCFDGRCCVAMTDRDLFPRGGISMNGMKIFGDRNVSQIVGYTYAVIAETQSGLEPAFHEISVSQNGRNCVIDDFRFYEGGGVGAEIEGNTVLVGSIGFMQLMGVRMPEGTNVRRAVYTAVNGTLAAVFAIQYHPSAAVRSGLQVILRCRNLTPVLTTRDFILTPSVVRHEYKVPADCLEYPTADERARLSAPKTAHGGERGALLSRESFLPLAEAAAAGRRLCCSVRTGLTVCLLSGALGFVITAVLSFLGAFSAASAFNLTLFVLLWTLPALLLSSLAGK